MIATREGVIKFQLDFQSGPAPDKTLLGPLEAWRQIFCRLALLGQDPQRYAGFGFGNLSRRLPGRTDNAFAITGTQTGHKQVLQPGDYTIVNACHPDLNRLQATGPVKPSSEALSHGILYQCHSSIDWVMHVHCPDIYRHRQSLALPCTDPQAEYGTPSMAAEIRRLVEGEKTNQAGLLVMTGHEDGILAFGPSAHGTGCLVIETLARALQVC